MDLTSYHRLLRLLDQNSSDFFFVREILSVVIARVISCGLAEQRYCEVFNNKIWDHFEVRSESSLGGIKTMHQFTEVPLAFPWERARCQKTDLWFL